MTPPDERAAFWDERYRVGGSIFGVEANAWLVAEAHRFAPGSRIFVPGDGDGRNGVWLAEQGYRVESVDLSPVGVSRALQRARARNVELAAYVQDLADMDWQAGQYDGIAAVFLHLPPELRREVHAGFARTLRPGGILVLEAFGPAQFGRPSGGPPVRELLYDVEDLRSDFRPALEEVVLRAEEVELTEGHRHRGQAAVVRAVFRKPEAAAT